MLIKIFLSLFLFNQLFAKIEIGEYIDNFYLKDQFNLTHKVNKNSKFIIIVSRRDSFEKLNSFLVKQRRFYLRRFSALYLVNISKVPEFIKAIFIISKIQTYDFPILIIDNQKNMIDYMFDTNSIIVLSLNNYQIMEINKFDTPLELDQFLNFEFKARKYRN